MFGSSDDPFIVWRCLHQPRGLCEDCTELARQGEPVLLRLTTSALRLIGMVP